MANKISQSSGPHLDCPLWRRKSRTETTMMARPVNAHDTPVMRGPRPGSRGELEGDDITSLWIKVEKGNSPKKRIPGVETV